MIIRIGQTSYNEVAEKASIVPIADEKNEKIAIK
jgi:hypothetical protein